MFSLHKLEFIEWHRCSCRHFDQTLLGIAEETKLLKPPESSIVGQAKKKKTQVQSETSLVNISVGGSDANVNVDCRDSLRPFKAQIQSGRPKTVCHKLAMLLCFDWGYHNLALHGGEESVSSMAVKIKRVETRNSTKSWQLSWENSHPPRVGPVAPVPAATCYFAGSLWVLVHESKTFQCSGFDALGGETTISRGGSKVAVRWRQSCLYCGPNPRPRRGTGDLTSFLFFWSAMLFRNHNKHWGLPWVWLQVWLWEPYPYSQDPYLQECRFPHRFWSINSWK